MKVEIHPSSIQGELWVPPSKSIMQRICALALMNEGTTYIHHYGRSEDDAVAMRVIAACGAVISTETNSVIIKSNGSIQPPNEICFGESGLSSRLFTPLLATTAHAIKLTAKGSLLKRSMKPLIAQLTHCGVECNHLIEHFPMTIKGPMEISSLEIDGSESSQYVTGFLYALSYAAEKTVTLKVHKAVSKPYIALSVELLNQFGHKVRCNDSFTQIEVSPRVLNSKEIELTVESDWSSASFLIVAALLAGDLRLLGLDADSLQADSMMIELLKNIKAEFDFSTSGLLVKKLDSISPFIFDATDCPDLFPPLAILAAYAEGITIIQGLCRLKNKESDRGLAIQTELGKLGVRIELIQDDMIIHGKGNLSGGVVASHGDHRIAMALAVAGLKAQSSIVIEGAESVHKSFPDFFEMLEKINVRLNYTNQ